MPKVILKKEHHTSKSDLKEAKDIIEGEDIDILCLEGKVREENLSQDNFYYKIPIKLFTSFFSHLQTSKNTLIRSAEKRNIKVKFTRETDCEVFEIAPKHAKILSYILAFFLVSVGVIFLIASPYTYLLSAILSITAFFFAPLIVPTFLRYYNLKTGLRDEKTAEKIKKEVKKGNKVLAAGIGKAHNLKKELREVGISPKNK